MDLQLFNKELKGKLLFIQQASSCKHSSIQLPGQEEVGSRAVTLMIPQAPEPFRRP